MLNPASPLGRLLDAPLRPGSLAWIGLRPGRRASMRPVDEAMLALDGCVCTSLGTQVPLWDVAQAAQALHVDIVGLSFSGCIGPNQVVQGLTELRARLAPAVRLWAGGSAPVLQRRRVPGVQPLPSLAAAVSELQRWRDEHESSLEVDAIPKMQA